jgi:hypothetical protein
LTRPKNEARLKGIAWSGQIRVNAWNLRTLLHASHAQKNGRNNTYALQLIANLDYMRDEFTLPTSPEYHSTGICNYNPWRYSPFLEYSPDPKPDHISTWHYHVLASSLNECVRGGFPEALPMLNHVLKVIHNLWIYSPTRYDVPWGNHSYIPDSWFDSLKATFRNRSAIPTKFDAPLTPDYLGWARSAIVAARDQSMPWADEALSWVDVEAPKFKGGVPLVWQISPERI